MRRGGSPASSFRTTCRSPRKASCVVSTFGTWEGVTLSSENKRQLYVPPGFAHGFCVLSERALFSYKCTDFYSAPNELGVAWNDPDIGIDWPIDAPLLSEKDAKNSRLKDIPAEGLPSYG